METHYFAFRDGKIVLVEIPPKKISEKEFSGDQWKENHANKEYEQALQSAIKNGKEVSNQNEVRDILWHSTQDVALEENKLYPLQCRVDILPWSTLRIYSTGGAHKQMPVHGNGARVTFDEQPEKETANAILNKFCTRFQADSPIEEGRPLVVTVTEALKAINFALCQQPEAAGQEQEDDLIEIVRLAYHALGKIRSEPTMSGTRYFPIPKEFAELSLAFHEKLNEFCGKHKHLVDKVTRKP